MQRQGCTRGWTLKLVRACVPLTHFALPIKRTRTWPRKSLAGVAPLRARYVDRRGPDFDKRVHSMAPIELAARVNLAGAANTEYSAMSRESQQLDSQVVLSSYKTVSGLTPMKRDAG